MIDMVIDDYRCWFPWLMITLISVIDVYRD
jgi:hypothetical protein